MCSWVLRDRNGRPKNVTNKFLFSGHIALHIVDPHDSSPMNSCHMIFAGFPQMIAQSCSPLFTVIRSS
jgi:hypothetical protein